MRVATLAHEIDFDGWRAGARRLRAAGVRPEHAGFRVGGGEQSGLFDAFLPAPPVACREPVLQTQNLAGSERGKELDPGFRGVEREEEFRVPKSFLDLASEVILHRSADRFELMYRLLWRLGDEPNLMRITTDRDVADALERAKNVSRASHKMKAFVRFRRVEDDQGEAWVAWFEPAHRVLEKTAGFFVRRFGAMRWSILTPDGAALWDGEALSFAPPATRDMAPDGDVVEDYWKTYYASTFNPARLKTRTMQGEMPKRYWKNLPEASLIPELTALSAVRTTAMVEAVPTPGNPRLAGATAPVARPHCPTDDVVANSLSDIERAVQGCRRCPLWRDATQGVCGQGPRRARLMVVGEQPGDQEDLAGRPFVGPAGKVFDGALKEVGIERSDIYVTNAVKHFKHEPRGKRRLHKTPNAGEVSACRWWLDQERELVKPRVILALGGTASLGVLGRKPTVTKERGRPLALADGATALITVHPSYLLRLPDEKARVRERAAFVEDLRAAKALL